MHPHLMGARQRQRVSSLPTGSPETPHGSSKGKVAPVITLRGDERDPLYMIRNLDRDCLRQKAIRVKSSLRWLDTFKTPNGGLSVPYIDQLGRITGHTIYKWSCDPRSLITTTISTILQRIVRYARRHNKFHVVKRFLKPLVGAAAYYCFSKNSHYWDRVLFFCRDLQKRGSLIHRLRLYFSSKWNDHIRFVYSQAIFQANWLLSRAFQPRDKFQFFSRDRRTLWRKPEDAPSRSDVTNAMRVIAYAISSMSSVPRN